MKFVITVSAWAFALLLGLALNGTVWAAMGHPSDKTSAAKMIGHSAPDFSLKDAQGKAHSLADFKGKTVVLLWTNPDCRFVQRLDREGAIGSLSQKFDRDKVQWIEIVSGQAAAKAMTSSTSATGNPLALFDPQGTVAKQYGAQRTPQAFVINNDGNLIYDGAFDNDPRGKMKASERRNYVGDAITAALNGQTPQVQDTKPYGCRIKSESRMWNPLRKESTESKDRMGQSSTPMQEGAKE